MTTTLSDVLVAELPLPDGGAVRLQVPSSDDHISKVYLAGQWYERDLLDYCRRAFDPGLVYVDIGAYVGGHSLWFALACGASKVTALEASPQAFEILAANVCGERTWDTADVSSAIEPRRVAVGPNATRCRIVRERETNYGMDRIEIDPGGPVQVERLDNLLRPDQPVDVVKVDVEGMAPGVLLGATETLARWHPALFVECRTEDERRTVQGILSVYGYTERGVFGWTPTYLFEAG